MSMDLTDIGPQARRVLKKLSTGTELRRAGAGYRLGTMAVPEAVINSLARADLIAPRGEGFSISNPGRRLAERLANPADPYGRQNRLITPAIRKVADVPQKVLVNRADNPLAWLARRNLVTPAQLDASDRLRTDYYLSHTAQRVTMNWSAPPLGGARRGAPEGLDPTLAQIAAKRRLTAALDAVGPGLSDVLVRVVCAGEGLETAEKALAWPARAAKLVLGFALDRLVEHYGIRA